MAQTVAVQRGSTTMYADGTRTTLFTQSTGTATRVILNGFYAYSNTNANYWIIGLSIKNSGASVYMPVAFKSSGGAYGSHGSAFLLPGLGAASNGGAAQTSTNTTVNSASVLIGTNNGWFDPTYSVICGVGNSQTPNGSAQGQYEYCPQNIWLGAGDALIVQMYNGSSTQCTIGWNMTTITES